MDSISGDSLNNVAQKHLSDLRVGNNQANPLVNLTSTNHNTQPKLNALSDLTERATNSDKDIRQDVVAKARGLLDDPNWLSDNNLLQLSEKLLDIEDFES